MHLRGSTHIYMFYLFARVVSVVPHAECELISSQLALISVLYYFR